MALTQHIKERFDLLRMAADTGHLCIVQAKDRKTGAECAVLAIAAKDGREYMLHPMGELLSEDEAWERFDPPEGARPHMPGDAT